MSEQSTGRGGEKLAEKKEIFVYAALDQKLKGGEGKGRVVTRT